MIEQVLKTINKFDMLSAGDTIVVGVSGGADSTALLHVLHSLKSTLEIKLAAVHVNHNIRGEAALGDVRFTQELCDALNVPCRCFSEQVEAFARQNGLSVEEAGRILRYKCFSAVADEFGANRIAIAHHRDDCCETLLFNLMRGTGVTGLAGIRPTRGIYIRPLIEVSRLDIECYLRDRKIGWRTDSTNEETEYTRNKIRHLLLPYMEENFNPSINSALARTSAICRDEDDYICKMTDEAFEIVAKQGAGYIKLNKELFCRQHNAIKKRLLRRSLEGLSAPIKDVHMAHIENCISFIENAETGSKIELGKCMVSAEQSGIYIIKDGVNEKFSPIMIKPGEKVFIEKIDAFVECNYTDEFKFEDECCAYLDADNIKFPIEIRPRESGDFFKPLGMNEKKKLRKYFIDKKIDKIFRDRTPLAVSGSDVLWVCGLTVSQDYKVCSHTNKILRIKITYRQNITEGRALQN